MCLLKGTIAKERKIRMHSVRSLVGCLIPAITLVGLSCSDSSVGHKSSHGSNEVRILDSDPAFTGKEDSILRAISEAVERASDVLTIFDVTVEVSFTAQGSIPGYGVGGFTPNQQLVQISIDPNFSQHPDLLDERLPLVVYHELHHAVRWRDPGYGSTLLEAMVSEGLADHYAVEMLSVAPPPWSTAISEQDKAMLREMANSMLDSSQYGHPRWFFGTSPSIPNWTGYTLGFDLISAYFLSRPGTTAVSLVSTSVESFRTVWAAQ